ncbi:flagellar basal body protein FliL [Micromonospora sp. Llam7]|uniref:LppU/SCO3897 family protein n=1 Tax=Micromonospora tarapacensis TaxID=2835305 RepID=UPI001C83AF19|nr:flagellar basal body protein FliL [Micromonospora tarapacensis]MBX7269706.1 flagellar basal body protein FliL [Micromonospora tarapacensis]
MANYGPPGGGPQPWHEPRPGEAYGRGPAPDPQPPHDPGQAHRPGPTYGGGPYQPDDPDHRVRQYGSGYPAGRPGSGYGSWQRGPQHDSGGYDPAGPEYAGNRYGAAGSGYDAQLQDTEVFPAYRDAGTATTAYAGAPEPPPERRRGRGPLLAVLAAVLVLMLGGATAFYLLGQEDEAPNPVAAPTEEPAAPPADGQDEDETPPDEPATTSSTDPRFVRAGQCVRNDAPSGAKPKLLISGCGAKSYEVLQRIDGKTSGEKDAEKKCAKVDGYTNWYFYDSELDSLDFVLCLKQRA